MPARSEVDMHEWLVNMYDFEEVTRLATHRKLTHAWFVEAQINKPHLYTLLKSATNFAEKIVLFMEDLRDKRKRFPHVRRWFIVGEEERPFTLVLDQGGHFWLCMRDSLEPNMRGLGFENARTYPTVQER